MNLKKVISITKAEDKAAENRRNLEKIHQVIYDCLVNLFDCIAIQGYCESCKSKQNVKPRYLDFKKISASGNMKVNCPACKSSKSVLIPNHYY